jgi:hypothetical protein
VLANPNVAAALVGASRPEQLDETVKASGITLDADTVEAINSALAGCEQPGPSGDLLSFPTHAPDLDFVPCPPESSLPAPYWSLT